MRLLAIFAFALSGLIVALTAQAGAPSLADRIERAVPALASRREESVDARELAEAVAAIPKVNADWAALVLTVGHHESALSARISVNDCERHECDGGRAWGTYQQHRNTLNEHVWGSTDLREQTLEAGRALRRAFYQCNSVSGGASPSGRLGSPYALRLRWSRMRASVDGARSSSRHVQAGEG